jgi:uncharacterized protein
MAIRNPLQEQLLKAGLAKKSKVDQAAREQARQRNAKTTPAPDADAAAAERARQEKIERDRALSAERNAQARTQELRAQIRQIVAQNKLEPSGETEYRFVDGAAIRSLQVTDAVRRQLASGALVIVRYDAGYAIVPRAASEKIEARDPAMIVLDHRRTPEVAAPADDDDYYRRFQVPDDLIW